MVSLLQSFDHNAGISHLPHGHYLPQTFHLLSTKFHMQSAHSLFTKDYYLQCDLPGCATVHSCT